MVMALVEYATISVPIEVKKVLEKGKGENEWGKYLLDLYVEIKRLKSKKAFDRLADTLTDEDLNAILESGEVFRKRFKLR